MKNIKILDLTNNCIFALVLFLIVFILNYLSSYFFYEYVKIRNYQEIRFLAKNLHYKFYKCEKDYIPCVKEIEENINYLKPFVNIKLSNKENNILLEYKKVKPRHINRIKVYIPMYLQKIEKHNLSLIISKESTPNIFKSTITSITFSLYDIYQNISNLGIKKTLIWYFDERIYLRSQNIIIFFVLAFLVIYLLKRKQYQYQYKAYIKDLEIINLLKKVEKKETDLSRLINQIHSQEIDFIISIEKYNQILKPTFNQSSYEKLLELDPETIIYKSRKVLEKIITSIYKKEYGEEQHRLDNMIGVLVKNKILNKKMEYCARIIQSFGNDVAHQNFDNGFVFIKKDAVLISSALVFLIKEVYSNNCLD